MGTGTAEEQRPDPLYPIGRIVYPIGRIVYPTGRIVPVESSPSRWEKRGRLHRRGRVIADAGVYRLLHMGYA